MKKLFIVTTLSAAFILSACSSNKTEQVPQRPQISVEEAMQQCKQASGETQDRAIFDACMKDKGFLRSPTQVEPVANSASEPTPTLTPAVVKPK